MRVCDLENIMMKRKTIKNIKTEIFAAAAILLLALAGCQKTTVSEENSPNLTEASITSYNEGSESAQYVKVTLGFDQDIAVSEETEDSLRITIAGERVQPEEYELTQGESSSEAELLISTESVTKGVLQIEKSEKADAITDITDASGEYAVMDFELEGLIPSGVSMSTVSSDDTGVTKQIDTAWNIRSIAWVGLTKDGELIPVNESDTQEELDGYVAVHGHEFLTDDEGTIAEKMAEALNRVYEGQYTFTSDSNRVSVSALNGEIGAYDIEIYQYLKINGEEVSLEDADSADGEDEHETGLKMKVSETDRDVTDEEQSILNCLHQFQNTDETFRDGSELYSEVTITGDAMSEEEVFSVKDLEQLIELSYKNQKMNELSLPASVEYAGHTYYGIDFLTFLKLCGVDVGQDSLYLTLQSADGTQKTVDLAAKAVSDADLLIVLANESEALTESSESLAGPMAYLDASDTDSAVGNLTRMTVSTGEDAKDPEYLYHNREPFTESLDKTFTVEVYQKGAEYLGALTTKTFTTEEFEQLMRENPEHVIGGFYGTIGNEESFQYMGVGSWMDYFKGLDLRWLLQEKVGLDCFSGSAELVGRDGEVYGTIDDLSYLTAAASDDDYYVLSSDGIRIPQAVPMIACTKNGYPILPEHDHESSGYIAYNVLNQSLENLGIETEVGVVKNHSGPFIACLGNLDGYYGGNQVETGGDCVLMRIYLSQR